MSRIVDSHGRPINTEERTKSLVREYMHVAHGEPVSVVTDALIQSLAMHTVVMNLDARRVMHAFVQCVDVARRKLASGTLPSS